MRPNLDYNFCKNRREELLKLVPDSSAIIIPSACESQRNSDVNYPFRQNSDFWYLTGFDEPNAVLLMLKKSTQLETIMFLNEKNLAEEIWVGFRMGSEKAPKILKLDKALTNKNIDTEIANRILGYKNIYTPLEDENWVKQVAIWRNLSCPGRKKDDAPISIHNASVETAKLKAIKTDYELDLMQKACDISAIAHTKIMQYCAENIDKGLYEYQLQSLIESDFMFKGAGNVAYSSIVAAGKNACVLHYVENSSKILPEDLILIDAGCEYAGYASDITRTFPANGKFTDAGREIYSLVLGANKLGIALSKPGTTMGYIHKEVIKYLTKGMVELGILHGDVKDLIAKNKYFQFFMHGTGHWLGLDVHDGCAYKQKDEEVVLQEGMVFTVEPGLYFLPNDNVDKKWHNIGVRIEDDVVITKTGCRVLSDKVVKEIDEIEALMAR